MLRFFSSEAASDLASQIALACTTLSYQKNGKLKKRNIFFGSFIGFDPNTEVNFVICRLLIERWSCFKVISRDNLTVNQFFEFNSNKLLGCME